MSFFQDIGFVTITLRQHVVGVEQRQRESLLYADYVLLLLATASGLS